MVPQLRQRAREMREAASLERQTWRPSPDSFHYRIYRWWMRHTTAKNRRKVAVRENFCHYLRVVLIWAPLYVLTTALVVTLVITGIGTLVWLVATHALSFLMILAIVLSITAITAYLVAGVVVAMLVVHEVDNTYFDNLDDTWIDRSSDSFKLFSVFLTAPVLIVITTIYVTIFAPLASLVMLEDEFGFFTKVKDWIAYKQFSEKRLLRLFRPWQVFPLVLLTASLWSDVAQRLLFICGVVLVIMAAVVAMAFLATVIEDHKPVRDSNATRDITLDDEPALVQVSTTEDGTPNRPGLPKRFLSAIADLLRLIWAMILTRKWKICPTVTLPL